MKKKVIIFVILILITAISLIALSACVNFGKTADNSSLFNEESNALRIFVRDHNNVVPYLEAQFPDIDFDFYYYDGKNTTSAMKMMLENDDIGDIYLGTLQLSDETAENHLLKLSGYEFCDNYEISILNQYDVDGAIYQVPAGIIMRCIVYNQDMFDKYGWKEPKNFNELVKLCRQIRRDKPEITPIVFGGAANGYYFTTMTTYAQTEFLYTPEGSEWESKYLAGNARAEDGFGEGIEMTQELIDAGAFDYEKNHMLWDNDIFQKRMETGEAAIMFAWGGQESLASYFENSDTRYTIAPFRNRDGDPFLGTSTSYNIGLAKGLAEPGNEIKLKNALRVMTWFSTEEGIRSLSGNSKYMICPLKNFSNDMTGNKFLNLWESNLNGIKAPMLYTGYEDIISVTSEYIIDAIKGKHDLSGLADLIDSTHQSYLHSSDGAGISGSFARTLSHEETVQLFADILYEKGDSDIALVSDGERSGAVPNPSGAHLKFYKGICLKDSTTCQVPGSSPDDSVIQMKLKGKTIKNLIENGKYVSGTAANGETASSRYPYYFSGMTVFFRSGRAISMNLKSGEKIEADKTYTVSFAASDFPKYIKKQGNSKKLNYSCYDALLEYLKENSPVAAPEVLR